MEPLLDKLAHQKPVRKVFETIQIWDKQDRALKILLIRLAILAVLLVEIVWALAPINLSLPRSPETLRAIHIYQASPSTETQAMMLEQIHRDGLRNTRLYKIAAVLMLVADVIVIYFFWNYGVKKSPPAPAPNLNPCP